MHFAPSIAKQMSVGLTKSALKLLVPEKPGIKKGCPQLIRIVLKSFWAKQHVSEIANQENSENNKSNVNEGSTRSDNVHKYLWRKHIHKLTG